MVKTILKLVLVRVHACVCIQSAYLSTRCIKLTAGVKGFHTNKIREQMIEYRWDSISHYSSNVHIWRLFVEAPSSTGFSWRVPLVVRLLHQTITWISPWKLFGVQLRRSWQENAKQ